MKEALLYNPLDEGKVVCTACARYCKIGPGQIGLCGIRQNIDGKLFLLVYGKVITGHIDPIEKKPVTHYMPGSKIFSIATTGCNWLCHPAGTKILLSDGQKKNVEELSPGDTVWSYDLENDVKIAPSVVTHTGSRHAQIWEVRYGARGEGRILLTEEHPVLTESGWKTVGFLNPGDRILKTWYQNTESWKRKRAVSIQQAEFTCKSCGATIAGLARWNRHRGKCYARDLEVPPERRRQYSRRMRVNNPMKDPEVAKRALATNKERFLSDPAHGWHKNVKRLRRWLHRHPSAGQERLYELLDELGVHYEKEFRIHPERRLAHSRSYYIADAAILEIRLDIEVDGWWHYHDQRVKEGDEIRDRTLRANGWEVLRISGSYLFNHPEEVKALIAEHLSQPIMVNKRMWLEVHSVRPTDRVEPVYSLETIPNHNYVADGIVVHNCQYCLPGDATISTDQGMLPVQELWSSGVNPRPTEQGEVIDLEGVRALTHRGRLQPIQQVHRHFYSDEILDIRAYHLPRLRCTPDHRVFAAIRGGTDVQKVPSRNLQIGDYLAVPRSRKRRREVNVDVMEIFGRLPRTPRVRDVQLVKDDGKIPYDFGRARDISRLIAPTLDFARAVETSDYLLLPIRSIERTSYVGYVYNLAVDTDHSYVAEFVAVANCQNYDISQRRKVEGLDVTPRQVVDMTLEHGCQGIAYTYNQPSIFIEFAHDIGVIARQEGLINIFVSNGYDTPDTVRMMKDFLDCITVDFKGNGEPKFTRKYIGVIDPQPIFDTLIEIRDKTDVHIEITDLVVPQVGDDLEYARKLAQFVYDELGPDMPIHFLRFHPDYKMMDLPSTPVETLEKHHQVAKDVGLRYVYIGNVPGHPLEDTHCPGCGRVAIKRHGFDITSWHLDKDNRCKSCGYKLSIVGTLQDTVREFRFRPVM